MTSGGVGKNAAVGRFVWVGATGVGAATGAGEQEVSRRNIHRCNRRIAALKT